MYGEYGRSEGYSGGVCTPEPGCQSEVGADRYGGAGGVASLRTGLTLLLASTSKTAHSGQLTQVQIKEAGRIE